MIHIQTISYSYNRFSPFFLFATPPIAAVLLTAPPTDFGPAPLVPEAGWRGPFEAPAFTLAGEVPDDGPFSFIGVPPRERDEEEGVIVGLGCGIVLLLEGDNCRGSVNSTTARRLPLLDFDASLEGRGVMVSEVTLDGVLEGPGTGVVAGSDVLEDEATFDEPEDVACGADGVSNSAGRIRGVACTDVTSFACLKYSS